MTEDESVVAVAEIVTRVLADVPTMGTSSTVTLISTCSANAEERWRVLGRKPTGYDIDNILS